MTSETNAASPSSAANAAATARTVLAAIADKGIYLALGVVFLWFGGMKFTAYEAGAIQGLASNSPLTSFLYGFLSVQGVSNLIGTTELVIAALLFGRFASPKLSLAGAAGAVATFIVTFSFFFSTPGVFLAEVGGPAISVLPGQFLLKDLALLAASLWAVNDSLAIIEKKQQ